MDTPVKDTAVFFLWHLNTAGDRVRPMNITVENITVEHIYSHMDVIRIGSYAPSLTLRNIYLNKPKCIPIFRICFHNQCYKSRNLLNVK